MNGEAATYCVFDPANGLLAAFEEAANGLLLNAGV